jgi:16S rRNA G966 N2-methylase RsmD
MLAIRGLRLVQTDVFRYIDKDLDPFDLVFADPPFDHPRISQLPEFISKSGIVKPGGTFILEHGPDIRFDIHPGLSESRVYGKVHFSFFSY